ncbi:LysR family transcriptional regulator [Pontibacillus litoralis]|uniref:Transcriptional regulator n=1 Tax=Pontibacillus litoralis JSM 072002 TaxID=1385512 RepID=A0A0A5G243_9BACI|nr:LysR family transcriptional regulator [Pontibacillus litoralis]KGX87171.1 transcriptional regulator [Pontibacillus litoralis JSM 072002]
MNQAYRVYVYVVELGGFSKAANALYMTQPAVSQYIKALENEIGTSLLDRGHKHITMTKAGKIVYEHAKEILHHHETMHHLIHDLYNEPKGEIAIGASYTFGEYVLPNVMARLRNQYPLIQPTIHISNTLEIAKQVDQLHLDIGIVEGEVEANGIQVEHLAKDVMYIVAAKHHPLADLERIDSIALEDATWITREVGSGTREATDKLFEQLNIHPANRMEFGSTQVIKESVEAGLGLSLLSKWAIRKELEWGLLMTLPVEQGFVERSFSILLRKKLQQTRSTMALKQLLQEYVLEEV